MVRPRARNAFVTFKSHFGNHFPKGVLVAYAHSLHYTVSLGPPRVIGPLDSGH